MEVDLVHALAGEDVVSVAGHEQDFDAWMFLDKGFGNLTTIGPTNSSRLLK